MLLQVGSYCHELEELQERLQQLKETEAGDENCLLARRGFC